ncbi:MAG TPA: ABC transporter ATP-binding protein [Streptosporangiaceae bacterium]|nr:ABC transporter ATP-binding protein [Streptosporangiaceae bacterium]
MSDSTSAPETARPAPERAGEPLLDVSGLCKSLTAADGSVVEVSRDITLSLREGEFVSVVGPSGAGKTTLLRAISGLAKPDRGTVRHRGEVLTDVPGWLSIVFQEYNKTLFPWLSVSKNVLLAVRSLAKADARARTMEALELVGLAEFSERYPWELSGGMQQRVALARAMVSQPELLMMDEPFASVDALTRTSLEDMVLRLWAEGGFAALLVTHDIGEAVYLSDRVLVLSARPSTVLTEIHIDLPRPRNRATRARPRFHELAETVLSYIEHRADAAGRTAPGASLLPGN